MHESILMLHMFLISPVLASPIKHIVVNYLRSQRKFINMKTSVVIGEQMELNIQVLRTNSTSHSIKDSIHWFLETFHAISKPATVLEKRVIKFFLIN